MVSEDFPDPGPLQPDTAHVVVGYLLHVYSTDLVEVVPKDFPDPRPLQPDTAHVVVGYLHYLGQAEHSRVVLIGQLIH